ncbi:MAG TPA: tetratricopeptide repeat protein [Pyrinomonadaceae bacterium]|jgi:tetratricopeptide (TPR) repeat protein|nr:tetratricopeptide repeat protein [Pyrinomonadaceae bacterium]
MSDPVIKGAKRPASRPAPHNISSGATAKNRKPTAKTAARPALAKRTAAEKSPVRKATPAKNSTRAAPVKSARPSKQTKNATPARKTDAKSRPTATATPAKPGKVTARPATKQAKKSRPAAKSTSAGASNRTRTASGTHSGASRTSNAKPAPAAPRQPTRDEAAALRAFERAHKEFTRGRFADARNLFRSLIEQHSGVSEVTARARTYLSIAETRLRSESALPRDAEALYDRGVIELNRGEYVAAQELFERALKRDDHSPDTHYALAATRARLGSIPLALQSLERALELKPNLRVRAQHDPDLAALRNEPDYERLVFPARV